VSVANTGPSELIDPRGRVRQSLETGVPATGVVTVPLPAGEVVELTGYGRWGETPLLALLLAGLVALGPEIIRKRNERMG